MVVQLEHEKVVMKAGMKVLKKAVKMETKKELQKVAHWAEMKGYWKVEKTAFPMEYHLVEKMEQ